MYVIKESFLIPRLRYYLGRKPVVVIADPDLLRQVMVKDFSSFPNRMVRNLPGIPVERMSGGWSRRRLCSPVFLCADSALRHQTHGGLFAGPEGRAVEESEEHPDSVLQCCQDERSETKKNIQQSESPCSVSNGAGFTLLEVLRRPCLTASL